MLVSEQKRALEMSKIQKNTKRSSFTMKKSALAFMENSQEYLQKSLVESRMEELYLGHLLLSLLFLSIQLPIVAEIIDFKLAFESPYYYATVGVLLKTSLLCLCIGHKQEHWFKIVLIGLVHISIAFIIGPILVEYEGRFYPVCLNYAAIMATTALSTTLCSIFDDSLTPKAPEDTLDNPMYLHRASQKVNKFSCWYITGILFLVLVQTTFFVAMISTNYNYDMRLQTSIYSVFSVALLLINGLTILNVLYTKLILQVKENSAKREGLDLKVPREPRVTNSIAQIHVHFFGFVVAFVFAVVSAILFLKAVSATMDGLMMLGLIERNELTGKHI